MEHTKGPWEIREFDAIRLDLDKDNNCLLFGNNSRANARLIAAAPIGYELADAILNQAGDGLDRTDFILSKATELLATSKGN